MPDICAQAEHMFEQGMLWMEKTWIAVVARHETNGAITPLKIVWTDGREFEIDKIFSYKEKCPSFRSGGLGSRYHIRIRHKEYYLFKDYNKNKWFVEPYTVTKNFTSCVATYPFIGSLHIFKLQEHHRFR